MVISLIAIITITNIIITIGSARALATHLVALDTLQRGVQSEGGAVDGGSII